VPAPTQRAPDPAAIRPSCVVFTIDAISASARRADLGSRTARPRPAARSTAEPRRRIDEPDPRHDPVDQPRRDVVAVRRRPRQLARRLAQPRLVAQRVAGQARDRSRLRRRSARAAPAPRSDSTAAVDSRTCLDLDRQPGDPRRRRRRAVRPAPRRPCPPPSARPPGPRRNLSQTPGSADHRQTRDASRPPVCWLSRVRVHVTAAPARRRSAHAWKSGTRVGLSASASLVRLRSGRSSRNALTRSRIPGRGGQRRSPCARTAPPTASPPRRSTRGRDRRPHPASRHIATAVRQLESHASSPLR
jgi:hypothetical protein